MQTVTTINEMQSLARRLHQQRKRIGFVPTMGALHDGHLSLVRACRRECDIVVISIFVNPLQFGPREDYAKYPRDLSKDSEYAVGAGTDIVFAPLAEDMYPAGFYTHVEVEGLSDVLEGAVRPGHFRGVATVVAKLFNAVHPDIAYFGQKDAQQALIIRRMTADLNMGIEIKVLPTVREPDGLAMSSRNVYLNEEQRRQALCLRRALGIAEGLVKEGTRDAGRIDAAMRQIISESGPATVDYIAVVDPETLAPAAAVEKDTLIALAVRIGQTRLIDNLVVSPDRR